MLNHLGTNELHTKKLILRPFKDEDAMDMYNNWASDPEVTKYLSWSAHSSIDLTKQLIGFWIKSYSNLEHYQWAIELKEERTVIGNISLLDINNQEANCEVGYCIGKEYWNKGIVTEALNEIIKIAFDKIGFERVGAHHEIGNLVSGRVLEKCKFKYEGTLRKILRNNEGNLVDCKYYSILKEEFLR